MPDDTSTVPPAAKLEATASVAAPPCAMVIFGAGGDLTKRLLVPALHNLSRSGMLPDHFALIGVSHRERSDDVLRQELTEGIQQFATAGVDENAWNWLAPRISCVSGDFDDPATYEKLRWRLAEAAQERGTNGNVLFYLATSAKYFASIAEHLARSGLSKQQDGSWRRVIVEKPFGADLPSARELNKRLLNVLDETQIYRIDHYLGKETVQNIMVFRFGNSIFEPLWSRDHIDHVQITVAETVGVEQRGNFYDHTGALRDMVPNHLFQLLAMTAMEPPSSFAAEAVRGEKVKVLDAVHSFGARDAVRNVVRGQYAPGTVKDKPVKAYLKEPNIAPHSSTETYVAMRLMIDNWRWAGVPFYLRTGKALSTRRTQVVIDFKSAPFSLFRDTPITHLAPNRLVLKIQPNDGISLQFGAKIPGTRMAIGGVKMDFAYKDYFNAKPTTGYETLLYDCMQGDATLFQRADNAEAGWRVVQPILDSWAKGSKSKSKLALYPAGSEGPMEADELLARDGRAWAPLT